MRFAPLPSFPNDVDDDTFALRLLSAIWRWNTDALLYCLDNELPVEDENEEQHHHDEDDGEFASLR